MAAKSMIRLIGLNQVKFKLNTWRIGQRKKGKKDSTRTAMLAMRYSARFLTSQYRIAADKPLAGLVAPPVLLPHRIATTVVKPTASGQTPW